MTRYKPADSSETPRFSGVRTFMRLPNVQDLENADAAIVGAPFDTGSSFRVGARFGPEGIRSASHFRRAVEEGLLDPSRSIQIGMRGSLYEPEDLEASRELGFELVTTDEVREVGIPEVIFRIRERMGEAKTYVSFDVDFCDPAYAPGTGTPEVGGFTSWEAQEFLRGLAGLRIVGGDVVEVYPAYDPAEITSFLAANATYEILSLVALFRQG